MKERVKLGMFGGRKDVACLGHVLQIYHKSRFASVFIFRSDNLTHNTNSSLQLQLQPQRTTALMEVSPPRLKVSPDGYVYLTVV